MWLMIAAGLHLPTSWHDAWVNGGEAVVVLDWFGASDSIKG